MSAPDPGDTPEETPKVTYVHWTDPATRRPVTNCFDYGAKDSVEHIADLDKRGIEYRLEFE